MSSKGNTGRTSSSGLLRNTVLNILGQALPFVVAFLSVPGILRLLGETRFGILSTATIVLGTSALFDLGMSRAVIKFAAEAIARGEEGRLNAILGSTLMSQVIVGSLGVGLVWMISPFLVQHVFTIPPELIHEATIAFRLTAVAIPATLAASSYRGLLEASQRFDISNCIRAVFASLAYAIPLMGARLGWQLTAIVGGLLVSRILQLIVSHVCCVLFLPSFNGIPIFVWSELRRMLRFTGWVGLSNVLAPVQMHIDKLVLAALLPVSLIAYFATALEVVTGLCLLPTSLAASLFPIASGHQNSRRGELMLLYQRATKLLLTVMAMVVFSVIHFAQPFLRVWIGPDFALRTTPVVQILALGLLPMSVNLLAVSLFQGMGRADVTAKQQLLRLPVALFLSLSLISYFGLAGAALSWCLTQTCTMAMYIWSIRKVLHWSSSEFNAYALLGAVLPAGVLSATVAVAIFFLPNGAYWEQGVSFFGVVVLGVSGWRYSLMEEERQRVVGLVRGFTARGGTGGSRAARAWP